MSIPCLFEDRFEIRSVDSSKFERVCRLKGKSSGFDADIQLDVNSDLLPVKEKQRLYIGLTNSLQSTSSARKEDAGAWAEPSACLQEYDYVMYGKIFRIEECSSERRILYASFGGLLMALAADKHVVGDLELDMRIYILIRRSEDVHSLIA
ncbi:DNA-directed RNA polymerase II RPBABC8 [Besnoitia besnoiti]|uniref:DNA-directed RNA polymerases I, II, and III subunit RPABC3 n=1 Tax=Besnoitia besnoiti TaxID=94643 RepID=A0A2A9MQF4_BESBE|nr:DNA-directed RNA polymerase II RPBABC8 [Besnoitia besnoiti]PFH38473.1 DNA-directed RNA polymerase II RPBABC8 [Besnoitia besnoiti]